MKSSCWLDESLSSRAKVLFQRRIYLVLKVVIQLQLLASETEATSQSLFGKDTFEEPDCWQDNIDRIVYVKQLMTPQKVLQYHLT